MSGCAIHGPSRQLLQALIICFLLADTARAKRFAIVSVITGPVPKAYYAQAVTNRALYATRHSYTLRLFPTIDERRPTAWSKVLAMKSTIRSAQYDWILWMDADALITNFEISLDEFVPYGDEIDMLVATDCNGLNTGVFLLRSSPSALELLEEAYNGVHVSNNTIDHVWWEQMSFVQMYAASEDVRKRTYVLPQKSFNSYPTQHDCSGKSHSWSEGDFIVHFPGHSDEDRMAYFEEYLHKVLQHG